MTTNCEVVGNLLFNGKEFKLVEPSPLIKTKPQLLISNGQAEPLVGAIIELTTDYGPLYPHPNPRPYKVNEVFQGTRFILNPDERLNELVNNNHATYGWSLNILHQKTAPSPELLAAFGINVSTLYLIGRERFVDDLLRKIGKREKPIDVEREENESIGVVDITDPNFYKRMVEILI